MSTLRKFFVFREGNESYAWLLVKKEGSDGVTILGEVFEATTTEEAITMATIEVRKRGDCVVAWVGEIENIYVLDVKAIQAAHASEDEERRKAERLQYERDEFNRLRLAHPDWFGAVKSF